MHAMLTDTEVRVLGALVEKAVTTPEYYPLTLNALTNACNQKSNRDPVVAYDDRTVARALEGLKEKSLVWMVTGERVARYKHYFEDAYHLDAAETAILCELLLRGPQTVGELRGRAERFGVTLELAAVETMLETLATREDGALVMKLPRQPGRKESRYAHLLAGEPVIDYEEAAPRLDAATREVQAENGRIAQLEAEVQALRQELAELKAQFQRFTEQF